MKVLLVSYQTANNGSFWDAIVSIPQKDLTTITDLMTAIRVKLPRPINIIAITDLTKLLE